MLGDVLDHELAELGERDVRQHAPARLDLPGDRERVPEGLAEPFAEEEARLRLARVADAREQRGVGRQEIAAAAPQRRGPGLDRGLRGARRRGGT